jgi:hypothetical protein
MTYLPTEIFADLVERWVARGRALDAAWDDEGVRRVMRWGFRYRLRGVIACAVFGLVCLGAVALEFAGIPLGFWLWIAYACFIFPIFLVSVWHAVGVCCTTVVLSETAVAIRVGFVEVKTLEWSQVSSVRYSTGWSDFVIEGANGGRLRIPTQMDGLRTLCDYFLTRLDMAVVDPSVPIAMAKLI